MTIGIQRVERQGQAARPGIRQSRRDVLRDAQAKATAVALNDADRAGLTGEKIGELLRRRRLGALKAGA